MSASHLLVRAGEALAALPAAAVRHVARALPVAALPGARGALLGLVSFGGEPLPVLDLGRVLGSGSASASAAVTVFAAIGADGDRELVGLAVDEALAVVELSGTVGPDGAELRIVDLATLDVARDAG